MRNKIILLVLLIGSFSIAVANYVKHKKNTQITEENSIKTNRLINAKIYTCPMHSHIVSDQAGSCPICGMDLVLNQSSIPAKHAKVENTQAGSTAFPEVKISPTVTHNLGIKTTIVKRGDLSHNIETIGKITRVDPMARRRITSPINGKIVKITDKYEGDEIKRDEFLFSVASDQLFKLEKDFQDAFVAGDKATSSAIIPRLVAMGLDTGQLEKLQNGAKPSIPAVILANEEGYIFTRRGKPGDAVTSAFTVFNLGGNYQVIEVTVEIFERQWDLVKEGQSATMQLRNLPGKLFHGKVERVDEPVGYTTRALETRIHFKTNRKGLTQSTFARVIIKGKTTKNVITVPRDAVIRTAKGNRIIKVAGNGHFQPLAVEIGEEADGMVQILSGVKPGDKVVTSGQFLIDSESNLLADLNRMSAPDDNPAQNEHGHMHPANMKAR